MSSTFKLSDGSIVENPVKFSRSISPGSDDIAAYPWLENSERYYKIISEFKGGGRGITCLCQPCDENGKVKPNDTMLLKFPRSSDKRTYLRDQRVAFSDVVRRNTYEEWKVTRTRLRGCKYAVRLLDIAYTDGELPGFVTVQPYLGAFGFKDLDEWLTNDGLRKPVHTTITKSEITYGPEILDWRKWASICKSILEALSAVHSRNIVHGDIWPDNIFVKGSLTKPGAPISVNLIDFGESFLRFPDGETRPMPDHPYSAPERRSEDYVTIMETVDIYSFGKVALYLATGIIGESLKLSPAYRGHRRREQIRTMMKSSNPVLLHDSPWAVDLIAKCCAFDPVQRTPAKELLKDFALRLDGTGLGEDNRSAANLQTELSDRLLTTYDRISDVTRARNPVALAYLESKIRALEEFADQDDASSMRISGSRDELIGILVSAFASLQKDGFWSAITAPTVWRGSALGLDGRFLSATIDAVRRGASVHRTFVVSVEELGPDCCRYLISHLEKRSDDGQNSLSKHIKSALEIYERCGPAELRSPPVKQGDYLKLHQLWVKRIAVSYNRMMRTYELDKQGFVWMHNFPEHLEDAKGLYLGLRFVPTLLDARALKIANPASIVASMKEQASGTEPKILIVTDIGNRHENEHQIRPRLHALRIFAQHPTNPEEREGKLVETHMSSVNFYHSLKMFSAIFDQYLTKKEEEKLLDRLPL